MDLSSNNFSLTLFASKIARPEYRDTLESEIRKAHVICIVYAIDEQVTFNRLGGHWLPYIRSLGVNVRRRGKKSPRTGDRSVKRQRLIH